MRKTGEEWGKSVVKVRQWYRGQTRGKAVADLHRAGKTKLGQNYDKKRPFPLSSAVMPGNVRGGEP